MASFALFLAFLSVFSYPARAATDDDTSRPFNITTILNKHSDYGSFNALLSQYKVADIINHRKTITVLAVTDVSAITSHPDDAAKRILMNHVILDFYGLPKLKKLKKSIVLTTLLQTTGSARSLQGFVNITVSSDSEVVMGSAVKDAEHNSKVLKEVYKQPFDICVLAISQPIVAPGVDKMVLKESPSPAPKARSPRKAKAPKSEEGPSSEEEDEDPPSPPSSEAPGDEPTAADEPSADKKDADAPAPESSTAARRVGLSVVAAVMGFMCFLAVV